jgi:chromosome segregation ATPase
MTEPDNIVLHLLREMRGDIKDMRAEMATKADIARLETEVRSEMKSLRADVASDLHNLDAKVDKTRKELSEQIVGLRRAVVEYHSAVVGHGMIISDLEARLRRVEQH